MDAPVAGANSPDQTWRLKLALTAFRAFAGALGRAVIRRSVSNHIRTTLIEKSRNANQNGVCSTGETLKLSHRERKRSARVVGRQAM